MTQSSETFGAPTATTGQRRHVTLLFCDLCDYTTLTESIDPEDADALRRGIEGLATEACNHHGGAISQCYGDGILAVFGLPAADEQDVRAALETALELREAIHDGRFAALLPAGFELGMHFGIHTGLVFVRQGDRLHGRYDLTGDTVNTAARLCSHAERDEILVSEQSLHGVEPFFEARLLPDLTLKGKRGTTRAYRIEGRSRVKTRFEASESRGLTPFVNRADELQRLEQALAGARPRQPRLVTVLGSAGMGKTRVIEEFLHSSAAQHAHVARGYCENYGSVPPLQPFVQIVRQLLGIGSDVPASRAAAAVEAACSAPDAQRLRPFKPILLHALSLGDRTHADAQGAQRSLTRGIAALIDTLAPGPLVLAIDDWQWVDDLSHQLLRGLIGTVRDRGLLVLLAARHLDPDDGVLTQARSELIHLRPLEADESARVIDALLPSRLDLGLTQAIHHRSGGNPLFLEELCRALPDRAHALDRTRVPHTIQGVLQARLERLPPDELQVLRAAAVIGNEFERALLVRVVERDDVDDVLRHLTDSDVIRPADSRGVHRFKHGLAREVLYESVLLSQRRDMHARVAEALERRAAEEGVAEPYEALAHHYAGSDQFERTVRYAELAGDRAALSSSLDRARLQYGLALAALEKLPDTPENQRHVLELSLKWARAWVYNPAWYQLELLEKAGRHADALGELDRLADVQQMCAWICYALGDQPRAIAYCRQGLVHAQQAGNYKLFGQLTSNLGQSHAAAGDYAVALRLLGRALDLKRERVGKRDRAVPVGFAYALGVMAAVHADQGDFEKADEAMSEALAMVHRTGHAIEASLVALRAMTELWQGRWNDCIATGTQACATAERVHGPYVFAVSQCMSSYARFRLRGTTEELQRLCSAVDWLEARDMGLYLSMAHGCAADAAARAGQLDLANDYAERALRRARDNDPFGKAVAHRVRAVIAARRDPDSPHVEAELDAAFRAAEARGSKRETALTRLLQARILAAAGDAEDARQAEARARVELDELHMSTRLDDAGFPAERRR